MIVSDVAGSNKDRQFVVRDSLVPHETRYTMTELGLLQFFAYTIEPAGSPSAAEEAIRRFASGPEASAEGSR
jgi:hypothetical protein